MTGGTSFRALLSHLLFARRSDADLQKDLSDTQLRFVVEELSKPGVDTSRCGCFILCFILNFAEVHSI